MRKTIRTLPSDLHGASRLTIDAIVGVVDLVEAMHVNIASVPGMPGTKTQGRASGITGLVYRSIRGTVGGVGHGLDWLLGRLAREHGEGSTWPGREALLAVLNGVLGEYLTASGNPLSIRMRLRRDGQPLPMEAQALAEAVPPLGGRVAVLLHGLCLNDLQWQRKGHDHGATLARDLGYTSVYLHYNSGRHISVNGREFAEMLEGMSKSWPVPLTELVLIGHSMGGLVARSACHYGTAAGHGWPRLLKKLVFLGTPHHGAPLERGGNWVDILLGISPYTAPFARLGKIRSAGITDLRHGNLVDEDWDGRDRFERTGDRRLAVPLPQDVRCYAIAATIGTRMGVVGARLIGDGIVPLNSALGRHDDPARALSFPEDRQWIAYDTGHLGLLGRPEVYAQLRRWLATTG